MTMRPATGADRGDTLIEILVALIIVSIAALALLYAFTTTIRASVEYKGLAYVNGLLNDVAARAKYDVENGTSSNGFQRVDNGCASSNPLTDYVSATGSDLQNYVDNLSSAGGASPGSYTVNYTSIRFWMGSSWSASFGPNDSAIPADNCPDVGKHYAPRLVQLSLTTPNSATYSIAVVVQVSF